MSKKLNEKDNVNNFVALPGESVCSSWDRFTAFVKGIPNRYTDDKSLKYYFYKVEDVNNKVVLDILLVAPMGYTRTLISYKSWRTYRTTINPGALESKILGKKTFAVQATNNKTAYKRREELVQMRTELGLVIKHVSGDT